MEKQTFAQLQTFEEFCYVNNFDPKQVHIQMLKKSGLPAMTHMGKIVAFFSKNLRGVDAKQTMAKLKAVNMNITFGIPHEGSVDLSGRPSMPNIMEAGQLFDGEAVALFE